MAKTVAALIVLVLTGCATARVSAPFAATQGVLVYVEVLDIGLGCPLHLAEKLGETLPHNACVKENVHVPKS